MRVWLQKQKKKDEAKAAVKAATPPVEATLAPEVQQTSDADKPVDSIEGVVKSEDGGDQPAEGGGPTIKIEPEVCFLRPRQLKYSHEIGICVCAGRRPAK